MKKILWLVALVIILIIIYAVGDGGKTTAGPIKIGFVGPLSGDTAVYGLQAQHVVEYEIKQINAAAGPNGQQFEVVYEDGKCTGSDASTAFQKLTDIDGVKVIIGGFCSSETLGMSPLANNKHIVLVSYGSSNPKIENEGPYTFSLSYSDSMTGEQMAKAASAGKKVAIISEQNDYNIGIRDTFVNALKQYPEATLVANEVFPKGEANLRGVLTKVRATNPDALVLNPNPGVTAETLLKQLAEMKNWTGYKIYTQYAYLDDNSRKAVGKFAEGMTIVDVPAISDEKFVTAIKTIEAGSGTVKDLGSYYAASLIDDVHLLTSEIVKIGNDPVKIQQDLATGSFKGFIGDINFNGNNFVHFTTPGIYLVTDGKAVLK